MMSIEEYIENHQQNAEKQADFSSYLFELMRKYGYEKNSDLILKSNILKQSFSQIISNKVTPSLNTCLKLVFALKANNHECKYLLKKAGYTLASSSVFALIIRYCIENKIYDLYDVNQYLERYGYDAIE